MCFGECIHKPIFSDVGCENQIADGILDVSNENNLAQLVAENLEAKRSVFVELTTSANDPLEFPVSAKKDLVPFAAGIY